MTHFRLTKETMINEAGVQLYRIELTEDCNWGKKGDKGGWVEKAENLVEDAWVSDNAQVYGDACVYGDARIYSNARVYNDARVYGDAYVYGDSTVSGDACVYGNARVYGDAQVFGNARVFGNAWVYGDAWDASPLQIQGSKHFLNICKIGWLQIGCISKRIEEWITDFEMIGKSNSYTDLEINEYGMYIELAKKINETYLINKTK